MRPRLQKEFVKAIQQIHVLASEELFHSCTIPGGKDTEKTRNVVKYAIRVRVILLLSVPLTVPTKLSEQPELLKRHVGLCFSWHIWNKRFWSSCYEDRMGLQQHLLIQGHFISPKVINHMMQAPTNQMRVCLCPAGILQTPCGGLWLRP